MLCNSDILPQFNNKGRYSRTKKQCINENHDFFTSKIQVQMQIWDEKYVSMR